MLYNPAATGLVVESAKRAARKENIELVGIEVDSPQDLAEALRSVDSSYDALWSVADRIVLSHGAVKHILVHTLRTGLPFVGLSLPYVKAGALFAFSTSYAENGSQAGALVVEILGGRQAGEIPIALPQDIEVVYNKLSAERLGIELSMDTSLNVRSLR